MMSRRTVQFYRDDVIGISFESKEVSESHLLQIIIGYIKT